MALVIMTIMALISGLVFAFGADGLSLLDAGMIALSACTLPWLVIGFWNAAIGLTLMLRGSYATVDALQSPTRKAPLGRSRARTALLMPIRNEDPQASLRNLKITLSSLDQVSYDHGIDVFILSDTDDPDIAAEEERLFVAWRATDRTPQRLHYRRRRQNEGFKAGNVRDFCDHWGMNYDYMVVLDCDSVMAGSTILRLIAAMETNSRLGILQTLVVGLPAESAFTRIFQFGMRLGMRSYTMGSAWWQASAGPYWGHNAILRVKPFMDHCRLPTLPGGPPLGGPVLSHDQVEAVLMARAGFEVRVTPVEHGSYEANPPSVLAFIRRELRWCQGNMQYFQLVGMPGLRALGRLQLVLAILMYTGAPCWFGFVILFLCNIAAGTPAPLVTDVALSGSLAATGSSYVSTLSWWLIGAFLVLLFAPKLAAAIYVLVSSQERRAFGGGVRFAGSFLLEVIFAALLAPVMAATITIFLIGLPFGRRISWGGQVRAGDRIGIATAVARLWPQTVIGIGFMLSVVFIDANAAWLVMPIAAGLVAAIPFATVTAAPTFGRWLTRTGLFQTPEETAPPQEVLQACPWLAQRQAPDSRQLTRDRHARRWRLPRRSESHG